MNTPGELKYTKDHEWVRVEGDTATIGITDFAQHELGDIVYGDIPSKGKSVAQHEVFGTVEAVKTLSDLFMPLSGEVIEVNAGLDNSPESVNNDAYGEGWMIKVKMSSASEVSSLMSAADYKTLVNA